MVMFGEAAFVDEYDFSSSEIQQFLGVLSDDIIHSSDENSKKRKRRILNRESARRSRGRKRMQFEKLNEEAKVLAMENRELKNRVFMVTRGYELVRTETTRLLSEVVILEQQLAILSHVLSEYVTDNNN